MPTYIAKKFSTNNILQSKGRLPSENGVYYRTEIEAQAALRKMHTNQRQVSNITYGLMQPVKMPEVSVILERHSVDRYDAPGDAITHTKVQIAKDALYPATTHESSGIDISGAYMELLKREEGLGRFAKALKNTPVPIRLGLKMQSPGYDTESTMDTLHMHEMYAHDGFVHMQHHALSDAILAAALQDIAKSTSVDAARHIDVLTDTFHQELKAHPDARTSLDLSNALEVALRAYADECMPTDSTVVLSCIRNAQKYVDQSIAQMKEQGARDYETAFAERLPVAMRSRFHQLYEQNLGRVNEVTPGAPENHALAAGAALHELYVSTDSRAAKESIGDLLDEANQDSVALRRPAKELVGAETVKYINLYSRSLMYSSEAPSQERMHDSMAALRANTNRRQYSDGYTISMALVVDSTKQVWIQNGTRAPQFNPKAITGVICHMTDSATQATHALTMPVHDGNVDWEAMREAMRQYVSSRPYGHFHQFANGVEVTLVENPVNLQDYIMKHLQNQLGLVDPEAQKKFADDFNFGLAYSSDKSLYGRIMDAAYQATKYIEDSSYLESMIAAAYNAAEAEIATKDFTTQITWQLSELPRYMTLAMRENIIGESALLVQKGYSSEQANALAFLKVINEKCKAIHDDITKCDDVEELKELREVLPQLTAIKERAAQIAIQAGCSKEAMLAVTRDTIRATSYDAIAARQYITQKTFEGLVHHMNQTNGLSVWNAIRNISEDVCQGMGKSTAATPQEDLQERIARNASKLQYDLKFHGVEYPVLPEAQDVLEAIPSYIAKNQVSWPGFISQYTSVLPYHLHESFINHYRDALEEINIYGDAQTHASMSLAACYAFRNMVKDETLTAEDQFIAAGFIDTAITQALQFGAEYEDVADIMRDGDEEIGDDN